MVMQCASNAATNTTVGAVCAIDVAIRTFPSIGTTVVATSRFASDGNPLRISSQIWVFDLALNSVSTAEIAA
jgi:hypothetical protein